MEQVDAYGVGNVAAEASRKLYQSKAKQSGSGGHNIWRPSRQLLPPLHALLLRLQAKKSQRATTECAVAICGQIAAELAAQRVGGRQHLISQAASA